MEPPQAMSHHRPAVEVAKSAECQITLLPLPSAVADRNLFLFFFPPRGFLSGFCTHIALETLETIEKEWRVPNNTSSAACFVIIFEAFCAKHFCV